MSYTQSIDLEAAYRPDFYLEEFFVPHLDANGDLMANSWLMRGY